MTTPLPVTPQTANYDLAAYGLTPRLPPVYSASSIQEYLDCEASFYITKILHRKLKGPEKPHFDFGKIWHRAQYAYNGQEDPAHGINAGLTFIDEHFPEDTLNETDPKGRTKARTLELFIKYVEKYGKLDLEFQSTVRREQYFRIHCPSDSDCIFGGCGLEWHGIIDLVRHDLTRDEEAVWDYKTTTYKKATYFSQHKHGIQFPGYVWLLAHAIPGTIPAAYLDLLHLLKASHNFERERFSYSLPRIIEWRENVKTIIAQIEYKFERFSHSPWGWIQNRGNCNKLWPCDHVGLHLETPDIMDTRYALLEQRYEEDTFDPSTALSQGTEI
jgi:hypothetical protein